MRSHKHLFIIFAITLLLPAIASAIQGQRPRNYDARDATASKAVPLARQKESETALRQQVPGLFVSYDSRFGVASTIYNTAGPLTPAAIADDARASVLAWAKEHVTLLGLRPGDLADVELTDRRQSRESGATHIYLRQRVANLPLYNGQLQATVDARGRILIVNNAFLPDLRKSVNTLEPRLSPGDAIAVAANHLQISDVTAVPTKSDEGQQAGALFAERLSLEPIHPRLMVLPIRFGEARLVWNFLVHTTDRQHVYDLNVDAVDGKVWTRIDLIADDSYNVFPPPVESPNHTPPLPPLDGRAVITNPGIGWHDGTGILRGNNVHAYPDWNNTNLPPATQPNCGVAMNCLFPLVYGFPHNFVDAATTNLFFWNNYIHDVGMQYGFDEISGNFQMVNTSGGLGNDRVRAEAQDGGGTNNANFFTPPDGQSPRMQMYLFTGNFDGDFDNLVISHEYGHGISNRLVGGPMNTSCLGNQQQPGEGWSDWYGLVFTHKPGASGTDSRGVGTFVLGQPPTGAGIRPKPYTTDPVVNNWTYASISSLAIPHGVGAVWSEILWRAHWSLIDQWGYGPGLIPAGSNGNHRMLRYVTEGMKSTACSPTFTQARDGIIAAATSNHGGVDVCRLWTSFARSGLGFSANGVSSNTTAVVNGFDVPSSCRTDVWSKDKPLDNGTEPNTMPDMPYESEDIWVRNAADNGTVHEDPKAGTTNTVYVIVRNRGAIDAHNVHVQVWGTAAATYAPWPTSWTAIGTATAVLVPANGSVKVSLPWFPTQLGHYCLISVLMTPQDPLAVPMTGNPGPDTLNNNNVIWRNMNVVQMLWGQPVKATLTVRNGGKRTANFTIAFQSPRGQLQPLLRQAAIDVALPPRLIEAMARRTGVRLSPRGVMRVKSNSSFVVTLPPGEDFPITLTFTATGSRNRPESGSVKPPYRLTVVQRDEKNVIVGGVTYEVHPPRTAEPQRE